MTTSNERLDESLVVFMSTDGKFWYNKGVGHYLISALCQHVKRLHWVAVGGYMRFFTRLATTMLVFLVMSSLFSEAFRVDNWMTALGAALVLAVLNTIIKPLLALLTLPLTFITFGLFTIVINGIMLEITADLVSGFDFSSFSWAMFTAIILSIVNTLLTPDLHARVERK